MYMVNLIVYFGVLIGFCPMQYPRAHYSPTRRVFMPRCTKQASKKFSFPCLIRSRALRLSRTQAAPPSIVSSPHYLCALQSMHAEIFFFNGQRKTLHRLYPTENLTSEVSPDVDLFPLLQLRARALVDPEHAQLYLEFYSPDRMEQLVEQGKGDAAEYRKRSTAEDNYVWYAAIMTPLPDRSGILIFLRDVSRLKEAENAFFTALAKNYGEIFLIDPHTNAIRFISRFLPLDPNLPYATDLTSCLHTIAETSVPAEDREAFLNFFALPNLQALHDKRKSTQEYRITGTDGLPRWVESLALPMPGSHTDEVLVLCQDISARKQREQEQRLIEQRYNTVFRLSCEMLLEVDLDADTFNLLCFGEDSFELPTVGTYTELSTYRIRHHVHPDDVAEVHEKRSIETLRRNAAGPQDELPCQYRTTTEGRICWLESRLFYIHSENRTTAYSVIRDITAQKEQEQTRNQEMRRLLKALRDAYTEVIELDLDRQTSRMIFSNKQILNREDLSVDYSWEDFIITNIHPADRARIRALYSGPGLRAMFADGIPEVSEEYRIKDSSGKFRWTSAMITPLRDPDNVSISKAMLFVKDISQRKEHDEQRQVIEQYTQALRNIYDIFMEINLTNDHYRLIHYAIKKYEFPCSRGLFGSFLTVDSRRLVHPDDGDRFREFFAPQSFHCTLRSGEDASGHRMGEFRILHVNGEFQWTSFTTLPMPHQKDADEVWCVFGINIHAHKTAEEMAHKTRLLEQQRAADERYKIIVDQTNTLIFEHKTRDNSRYLSPELALRFAGTYNGRDLLDVWKHDGVVHPEDMPLFLSFTDDTQTSNREMTIRLLQRNGIHLWCRITLTILLDEDGAVRQAIGTLNDVDEVTRATLSLRYKAERDPLTGIYNMRTFYAHAERLIRENTSRTYSIIRIDIDEFKVINDLYGMDEGDLLLQKMALTLHGLINERSVCGRISADVFCACVELDEDGILNIVHRLTDMLAMYPLPSKILPSFGICRVDNPETPINVLCDWAHLAQKQVKGKAVIFHAFYDDTLRDGILKEKHIENRMHNALDLGQFQLYLQPKVHIPTGRIIGAEGLVRWLDPHAGLIQPDDFIPLFEKNGFIIRLDEYIWEQACRLLRRWLNEGRTLLPLSVNVSRMHVHDIRLRDKILALTDKYDLPPNMLELELTENIFLDSKSQTFVAIDALRELGFRFSLDDFGAGYSSLNILKNLPVETLKIDRGFLDEVVATERGKTIIRCIITLAKSINMQVVAEGVETREQAEFLCQSGCIQAQGFHYARPLTVPDFESMAFTGIAPFCSYSQYAKDY